MGQDLDASKRSVKGGWTMPTKPLHSILYRELSVVAARDIIEIASPLLRETVNYATNVLGRCATAVSGKEEHAVLLLLYLHMIEMTDTVEILISRSCPTGAKLPLRSSFEALLSLEYILETDYERRCLCWLAQFMHERMKVYESFDPSTTRGKELQALQARDVWSTELPNPPEFPRFLENYRRRLAEPKYRAIESEYARGKLRRWYQLFGGPSNLCDLARHLDRGAQYECLYRRWSSITHAIEPARFLFTAADGTQKLRALRDPSDTGNVATFASRYIVDATRLVLRRLRPGEERGFAEWVLRDVLGPLSRLGGNGSQAVAPPRHA